MYDWNDFKLYARNSLLTFKLIALSVPSTILDDGSKLQLATTVTLRSKPIFPNTYRGLFCAEIRL